MRRKLTSLTAVALALSLSLAPLSRAETRTTTAPPINDKDFKSVCGDVLRKKSGADSKGIDQTATTQALAAGGKSQKLEYCKAAESARKGATINKVLAATWMGVAGVCAIPCFSMWAMGTLEPLCTVANLSATGVDAVTTANFAGALMSLTPQLATGSLNSITSSATMTGIQKAGTDAYKTAMAGKEITFKNVLGGMKESGQAMKAAEPKGLIKSKGSCIAAATAGIAAMTKTKTASSMSASAKENLASAARVNTTDGTAVAMNSDSIAPTDLDGTDPGAASTLGDAGAGGTSGGGNYRSECESLSSTAAAIECALASDPSLPGFVRSPEFQKQFQAGAGFPFSDLLNHDGPASGPLSQMMAGPMSGGEGTKLAAAIQAAEASVYGEGGGSSYAGGGGGGAPEGDPMLDAMNGLLSGLQGQLGGEGAPDSGNGVDAVTWANERRPASLIAEDRSLNLFDRVSYRYRKVANGRL